MSIFMTFLTLWIFLSNLILHLNGFKQLWIGELTEYWHISYFTVSHITLISSDSIQYIQKMENIVCGVKSHTCRTCLALHSVKMAVYKPTHYLCLLSHWSEKQFPKCRPVIRNPVNLPSQGALEKSFLQVNPLLQGWAWLSSVDALWAESLTEISSSLTFSQVRQEAKSQL